MVLLRRITRDPAVMSGKPWIRDMRVTVGTVVGLLAAGRSAEETARTERLQWLSGSKARRVSEEGLSLRHREPDVAGRLQIGHQSFRELLVPFEDLA